MDQAQADVRPEEPTSHKTKTGPVQIPERPRSPAADRQPTARATENATLQVRKAKGKARKVTGKKAKNVQMPLEDSSAANAPTAAPPKPSSLVRMQQETARPATPASATNDQHSSSLPANPFAQVVMTDAEMRACGTVGQYFDQLRARALAKERTHSDGLRKRFLEHAAQVERGLETLLKEARMREKQQQQTA